MNAAQKRNFRIAATAYELVKDSHFEDRYSAYAEQYSVPIRVRYAGPINVVLTEDRRLDVWYRGWPSRRFTRAAAFVLASDGSALVVSLDRRRMDEWLPALEEAHARREALA